MSRAVAEWPELVWPRARLRDALCALLQESRLAVALFPGNPAHGEVNTAEFIEWQAKLANCVADPIELAFGQLESRLPRLCPLLVALDSDDFLPVLSIQRDKALVIGRNGQQQTIPFATLCRTLRLPTQDSDLQQFAEMVQVAALPNPSDVVDRLLRDQVATTGCRIGWSFRPQPRPGLRGLIRDSAAGRNTAFLVGAHLGQYLLWLVSWSILGQLSLNGQMDRAWLVAWALLLFTLIPLRVFTTYAQGVLAIAVGAALKRRLLQGALRLQPQEVRLKGIGSILSQVFESEAVETLALSGGITGALAIVELAVSGIVLGSLSWLLLLFTAATGFLLWRFRNSYDAWTATRMRLSEHLVESMVGHRTRVAQQAPADWHTKEEAQLEDYLRESRGIDRTAGWLVCAIPRGWLLTALLTLAPSALSGLGSASTIALRLGGVLLAFSALQRVTAAAADIGATFVAARRIAPLFHAGDRKELAGEIPPEADTVSAAETKLLEVEKATFSYESGSRRVLQPVSLTVCHGERLLLEGPSGGGKSTLSSLLSGMRRPESGLILAGGLDRFTLGEQGWRKRVAMAPQFHENHILTETLAFNLLLGRPWPPYRKDLDEAEDLCRQLGLRAMLDRMPSGLMQVVGEGGWQLSHGERSRVFLARALLQNADLTILDESFGALDPETAQSALQCTLDHTDSLLVIAHP